MRVVTTLSIVLLSAAAACAKGASEGDDADDVDLPDASTDIRPDAGSQPDAGGDGVVASECPPEQFATGFDEGGALVCAPIDPAARSAVNQQCSIYLGWRDDCDDCTTAPAKWGSTSASTCANGAGGDNSCLTPTLGDVDLKMFGLNTDGDVDDNDKLYLGCHCVVPEDTHVAGPCPD